MWDSTNAVSCSVTLRMYWPIQYADLRELSPVSAFWFGWVQLLIMQQRPCLKSEFGFSNSTAYSALVHASVSRRCKCCFEVHVFAARFCHIFSFRHHGRIFQRKLVLSFSLTQKLLKFNVYEMASIFVHSGLPEKRICWRGVFSYLREPLGWV